MANYFARVELHDAAWPSGYVKLHEALKKHEFTNCISDKGVAWKLPTAFYHSTGRIDDLAIVTKAGRAPSRSATLRGEDVAWEECISS
jgi:hypothetical protein